MQHFWNAQHTAFVTTTTQQKLRPKNCVNIPLFSAIQQHVHGYALEKILLEHAKLPVHGPPQTSCICTTQQALGLPCCHKIWEYKRSGGVILLADIHRHWYYNRPVPDVSQPAILLTVSPVVLNPVLIKGKGRPRGALSGASRTTESSTKRYPSAFELPSSSAPPAINRPRSSAGQLFIAYSGLKPLSSTALAMARIEGGHQDLYEPGTRLERGYMAGISSIYKDDSIEDAAIVATDILERVTTISGVEVYTQDAEFDLDNIEELA